MINLNTKEKMPGKIKAYYFVKLILFIFLFSLVFMPLGSKVWTPVFWLMAIFIGLPIYLILLVAYSAFNFILEEGKITLNSGVIVKRSKAIAFDKVQNVESVSGILRRMLDYLRSKFGLHRLRR